MSEIPITRAFLQQHFIEIKEAKMQKALENKIEFIKSNVLTETEYGNTSYTVPPNLYEDNFLNTLINRLKAIFVDCDITVNHFEGIQKANIFGYKGKRNTTIKIEWTPLN